MLGLDQAVAEVLADEPMGEGVTGRTAGGSDPAHDLPHRLVAHAVLLGRLPQPEKVGVCGDERPPLRRDAGLPRCGQG